MFVISISIVDPCWSAVGMASAAVAWIIYQRVFIPLLVYTQDQIHIAVKIAASSVV